MYITNWQGIFKNHKNQIILRDSDRGKFSKASRLTHICKDQSLFNPPALFDLLGDFKKYKSSSF